MTWVQRELKVRIIEANDDYMWEKKLGLKNSHQLWKGLKEMHGSKLAQGSCEWSITSINALHGLTTAPSHTSSSSILPLPPLISSIDNRNYVNSVT